MVNKKAWIRIVEASIAIMVVLGVLIVLNVNKTPTQEDLTSKITPLLEEIANNESFRQEIVMANTLDKKNHAENDLKVFLATKIQNPSLNYTVKICELNNTLCPLVPYPGEEVYASDRIISSTLYEIEPKRVKIFLWKA